MAHRMVAAAAHVIFCSILCGLTLPAVAQDGSDLRSRILDAYQRTQTYQASIRYENVQQNGRWRLTQLFEVAFDRSSGSMRFDRPDMLFITDGNHLRFRSDMIPGRYVEIRLRQPLDYPTLLNAAPFLTQQIMPDVILLLGSDPVDGQLDIRELSADYSGRPGIRYETGMGAMTLRVDPNSMLVTQAMFERAASVERGQHAGPVTITYDISIQKHNDQFDREMFAFDTTNAQGVRGWGDLLASGDVDTRTLDDVSAPNLELKDLSGRLFRLKDVRQDVVVLGFWASWGGPQVYRALSAYQELANWASQEGKSVLVQTVNMREAEDEIRQVLNVKQLNLSVLQDTDGMASLAYRVGPVPQTVLVHKGRVVQVYQGFPPDFERRMRTEIDGLLTRGSVSRR